MARVQSSILTLLEMLMLLILTSNGITCESVVLMGDLLPSQIAILQFDSRPMENYWLASSKWNNQYAKKHGHLFLYYNLNGDCRYGSVVLSQAWCKVKAMMQVKVMITILAWMLMLTFRQANEEHAEIKVFIYMDSDAVIAQAYQDTSLVHLLSIMQAKLKWDPSDRPMVFNQVFSDSMHKALFYDNPLT